MEMLEKFDEEGKLPSVTEGEHVGQKAKRKGRSARRNSV
jgi:hypothetical protein